MLFTDFEFEFLFLISKKAAFFFSPHRRAPRSGAYFGTDAVLCSPARGIGALPDTCWRMATVKASPKAWHDNAPGLRRRPGAGEEVRTPSSTF